MFVLNPRKIKSPAWRFEAAKKIVSDPEDGQPHSCPYVRAAVALMEGDSVAESVEIAYLLYSLPEAKSILCSLLVDDPPLNRVAECIRGTEESVLYFSKLFFDTSVFLNRLILKEFIGILPESTPQEMSFKTLLRSSYNLGSDYIIWKKGLLPEESPDLQKITTNLMLDSYWRAREHKAFPIDSAASRESRAWLPQVLRSIDATKNLGNTGDSNIETLRLKLVKQDTTISLSALNSDDIKG